jgi:hypothetical protein
MLSYFGKNAQLQDTKQSQTILSVRLLCKGTLAITYKQVYILYS